MKMIKPFLPLLILIAIANQAWCQDFTAYNHYANNHYIFNPAAVTQNYDLFSYVITNTKQNSFENTPKYIGIGGFARLTDESSIGVKFNNYQGGSYNESEFTMSYGYKFQIVEDHMVALGLSAKGLQRNLNLLDVNVFQTDDPTLESGYYRLSSISFAFGMQYSFKNFQFHLALPRIIDVNSVLQGSVISYIEYSYQAVPGKLSLSPGLLINHLSKGVTWMDVQLRADILEKVSVQAIYRSNQNMVFLTSYNWDGIGLGYAYEMSVGPVTNYSDGCHEIQFTYAMSRKKYKKETITF